MEKYFASASSQPVGAKETHSTGTYSGNGGLLALMKKSREANRSDEAGEFSSTLVASSFQQWNAISTSQSFADVRYQTKHQKLSSSDKASQRGWRVVDGRKVYVTMRREGLVRATGREAYLLSRADEGKTNKCSARRGDLVTSSATSTLPEPSRANAGCRDKHTSVTTDSSNRSESKKLSDNFVKDSDRNNASLSRLKRKRAADRNDETQRGPLQSPQPTESVRTRQSQPQTISIQCDTTGCPAGGRSVGGETMRGQQMGQPTSSGVARSDMRSSSPTVASLFSF